MLKIKTKTREIKDLQKNRQLSNYLDIISLFTSDYNKRFSGREIGRMLNMNHQTALNKINQLVKSNILSFEKIGNQKQYTLNSSNHATRILIEVAEQNLALNVLSNKELNVLIPEIVKYSEALVLFGSFSSQTQDKKSDIDFVCIGSSDKNKIEKIKSRFTRTINFHYVSWKEFEKSVKEKNALAIEILENHKLFGNVSKIVDIFWRWYSDRR